MPVLRYCFQDPDAPRPNRPYSVGVVALIEQDGRLLLDRRIDGSGWGLIGGAVELEESLASALRREVREETGLHVLGYDLFGTFSDPSRLLQYANGDVVRIITLAYSVQVGRLGKLVCSSESAELRWFGRDELA